MKNIQCTISYLGTHYFGWQKTQMGPSIQEEIENALYQIMQEKVPLLACSRTDRGVHAEGQVISFCTQKKEWPLDKLKNSMNAVLPKDIRVLEVKEAPLDFHPTLHCQKKEYHYHLCLENAQLPFFRETSWHFPFTLDILQMEHAALLLKGAHDFSSFQNKAKEMPKDTVREVYSIALTPLPYHRLRIAITANRFLYKMARNIVGILVYIGSGRVSLCTLLDILDAKDRKQGAITAPAHGLSLKEVFYV